MTVPTIDCRQFDELLPDYLESTLSLPQRATLDAHSASCARCGELLADIRSIVDRAGALPVLQPSRDLWAGVAARLEAPVVSIAQARSARRRLRIPVWGSVAAAAAILIVVTSVVTRELTQRGTAADTGIAAVPSAPVRVPDSLGSETSAVATPTPVANAAPERVSAAVTYSREIVRLEAFMRERGSVLDPATTAIIENSMRIIDSALVEARAALARDPASRFLNEQVDKTLEKKLELLRSVTLLAART
ncbi:MAG TPA: zf-HC2 domain-containing protein [Gemmatimonadaceae bacterium]|nr:zf-HC2 domain-containing protein [Gemmatimonadaceae bacterium]